MSIMVAAVMPLSGVEDRQRAIHRVLWLILWANAAVAAAKIIYGYYSRSLAIRADGFHSVLDAANNVAALAIMRVAMSPPDEGHPYGHRKFEVLGSMAIGAMIVLLILRVGEDALAAFQGTGLPALGREAYVVLAVTLVVNLAVTTYEQREGNRLGSSLLVADARHTLADVFVTLSVLAGVVGVRFGLPKADAAATIIVLAVMAYMGYTILRRGIGVLADEIVIESGRIQETALSVDGVICCNRARSRGPARDVRVDLVIEVDPQITVQHAHEIADRVEKRIQETFPDVVDVVVHVEPHVAREGMGN